jgi:hypothetical protein
MPAASSAHTFLTRNAGVLKFAPMALTPRPPPLRIALIGCDVVRRTIFAGPRPDVPTVGEGETWMPAPLSRAQGEGLGVRAAFPGGAS